VKPRSDQPGVAIVGMSCRFPGAPNCQAYWHNLIAGIESIIQIADHDLLRAGMSADTIHDPDYVKVASVLENVENFDAPFFEYSPSEARLMDPQQRILLEVAWEAFEDAGYQPGGATGVFVGCGGIASSYLLDRIGVSSDLRGYTGSLSHLGNDKDFASTRISYKLNLTGPSINVQTACSTSLIAVHLACQSILLGECDMALAGASAVRIPQKAGYHSVKGGILSHDGHCRAFDADATGTVFGSGVGVVLLKDMNRAIDDGDRIYAVIRGSAINNDGADKVSYTASSVQGQASAMVEAMTMAQVDADEIGYVECHGTGTVVGDPLELNALSRAFRVTTEKRQFCAIGSVKTNFGHLEQCAGMAGLIKAALALYHKKIPPSLHFRKPNPKFDFAASAFYVNTECRDWIAKGRRRYAGVNSLGLGGTNAFAILEEPPSFKCSDASVSGVPHLFVLSAKTAGTLKAAIDRQATFLKDKPDISLADVSRTLTEGRQHFACRYAIVADALPNLCDNLRNATLLPFQAPQEEMPKLAFLFSGQASQYLGMAQEVYRREPRFRDAFDRCGEMFEAARGCKLKDIVFGAECGSQLDQTCNTQPALYAVQCGLTNLWRSWGFVPDVVLGHSVGEFAAAFCAGAYSFEDGLKLVLKRSELMQSLPSGSMASIAADQMRVAAAVAALECESLAIAALNAPESTVISGPDMAVMQLLAAVDERGMPGQKLSVSHAFHSPLMLPAMDAFRQAAADIPSRMPGMAWISTVTGELMADSPSADYWVDHALKPVRFSDAISALAERGVRHCVEVGPGDALLALGRQCAADTRSIWLASLRKGKECRTILESAGELYRQGRDVDWAAFNADARGRRVSLPTYPFERHRYWIDGSAGSGLKRSSVSAERSLSGARLPLASTDAIFESAYSLRNFSYLRDHLIYQWPVLPFVAGLVALCDATLAHSGSDRIYLSNVQYHKAMLVPEDPERLVQIILSPMDSGMNVRLSSLDSDVWESHMAGQARLGEDDNPKISIRKSIDAIKARCLTEIEVSAYYAFARMLGLEYGQSFCGIEKIYRGSGETLTRVSLPAHLRLPQFGQHPALLDACLHIYPALAEEYRDLDAGPDTQSTYLPIGVERFVLFGAPRRNVWVHVRRREQDVGQQTLIVDLDILDDEGGTVAVMDGLVLKVISASVLAGYRQPDAKNWLYRLDWMPHEDEAFPERAGTPRASWLILAGKRGLGEGLADRLTKRGDVCRLLHAHDFRKSGRRATINDMAAVLQHEMNAMSGGDIPPLRGVIDLRALDMPRKIHGAAGIDSLQHWIIGGAAAVFRALAHAPVHQSGVARVWLVTRNAVAATNNDPPTNSMMATIWGLGRSAALEHPNAWGGLIDLEAGASMRVSADILFERILNGGAEDQIAVRNGECLVARLVRMREHDAPAHFDKDAHYLITGGLGAVGSELAKWLVVSRGVRRLVLVSRQGMMDPRAPALCDELKALGADVMVFQADVTNEHDLNAVFSYLKKDKAVLKGVFHCAGLLDDGILVQTDWQKFSRVMMPKVAGAWLLDKLTRKCPLDHFVLFSSVLSLMGSAGQANYAAANTFLDSLVTRRRQEGLAALALNWGPWAAEGLATASGKKGRALWRARGTRYIEPKEAWAAFDALIGKCKGHAAITITDWPAFFRQFENVPPLYEQLRRETPATASAVCATPDAVCATPDVANLRARLAKATIEEQRALLTDFIGKAVRDILGITGSIDPARSLQQYGLDSLMSITLINRLEAALGVRIPMARLVRGPSLDELVGGIVAERNEAFAGVKMQASAQPQADDGRWLTIVGSRTNPRFRLFCFPFAGGGSAVYRTWVQSIDDDIEVIAIEPPGRLNRVAEEPVSDIYEFVEHVTSEVRDKLDRPFAFFGHCLGGLTMYETARRLIQTTSRRPRHLFVSGARPPDKLADQGDFEQQLLRDLMGLAGFRINLPSHAQPEDVFAEVIRRFNILATEQLLEEPELRKLMLPVVRAEFRMANNYIFRPEPPWDIPITCFYALQDPYVTRDHALGWGRFTNSRLQTYVRAGAHFAVIDDMEFITGIINRECRAL